MGRATAQRRESGRSGGLIGAALAPVFAVVAALRARVQRLLVKLRAEREARRKAETERERLRRTERNAQRTAEETTTECERLRRELRDLKRQLREERAAKRKAMAAAERTRRKGEVAELRREIERLKALLEEARREAKRQASPFRRRKRVENPKPPGRKNGHAAAHRGIPERVDEHVQVALSECPICGGAVEDVRDLLPIFVIDVGAPPNPGGAFTRAFYCQSGYCPKCLRRVQSRHPDQPSTARGAARVHIGARMQALAADLHSRVGVQFRKISGIFKMFFGVTFSPGAWSRANHRIAKRLEPTVRSLVQAARSAHVTNLDETGWYVAMVRGKKAWMHVLSAPELGITLFAIRFSRGRDVAEEILGDYHGTSVVDGWAAYLQLPWIKGQCHAHLLRRCAELLEVQLRGAARFPLAVERLLLKSHEVKALLPDFSDDDRAAIADQIRGEMSEILDGNIEEPANRRFANHLRRHEDELFTCLDDDAVPATNNEGERETRPGVIVRKIQGGHRTPRGAHDHEIIATCGRSAERNGIALADVLPGLLCSTEPEVILPLLKDRPMPAPVPPLPGWKALIDEPVYRGDTDGSRHRTDPARTVRSGRRRAVRGAGGNARPPPPRQDPRRLRVDPKRRRVPGRTTAG